MVYRYMAYCKTKKLSLHNVRDRIAKETSVGYLD